MQNPCCQVEGCNLDLKLAKDYHRRHRICETHSKSPKVIVAGMERRFCQQCSRFHDLSEFDDKKRSCRRRLSDHNARRRRVQPDSATSPAALYAADHQRQQNVLLNGLPVSTWENGVIRPRGLQGSTLNFGATDDDLSNLHTSNHCHHVHVGGSSNSSSMGPELLSAHSLLSSNSWGLNQGEEGNYSPDLTLFQTNNNVNIGGGGGGGGGFELHNPHAHAHQEYHLFKPPYDDSASFFSTQRTL
ncbi:squamosa promoter binding protein-like 2 [Perilla frutescens var. hirtella]|nr:squamosa promoter binding protein-like 2 [Perilla frutescens var. hirtella]